MFKNLGHNANDRICLFSSLARLRQVGLEKPHFVPIFKTYKWKTLNYE